jgi:hypothetical protein
VWNREIGRGENSMLMQQTPLLNFTENKTLCGTVCIVINFIFLLEYVLFLPVKQIICEQGRNLRLS